MDADKAYKKGNNQYNRRDYDKAEQLWREAAAAGHAGAMFNLGAMLCKQGNDDEGEQWLRKAASTGDAEAMYSLAELLHDRGKDDEAEQWLREGTAAKRRPRYVHEGSEWAWGWGWGKSGGSGRKWVNEMSRRVP